MKELLRYFIKTAKATDLFQTYNPYSIKFKNINNNKDSPQRHPQFIVKCEVS